MLTRTTHRQRRGFSTLIGATLALLLAGGVATANAEPAAPQIDATMDGAASLTVHKLELLEHAGNPGNGLPVSGFDAATPIDGVVFTIEPVADIDLTTNAGWQAAADLASAYEATPVRSTIEADHGFGEALSLTTGAAGTPGEATFTDLSFGLYYVTETSTPAGVIASQPFLVTVPLTHPTERSSWLYDVHVYPKNEVVGGSKDIIDGDATQPGDTVSYRIVADVPQAAVTDFFLVRDSLPEQLSLQQESIVVGLTDGRVFESSHYTLAAQERSFTVELTEAGREAAHAAAAADSTVDLVVSFDAVVDFAGTGIGNGEITNQAEIFPNRSSWDNSTPITPEVTSKWGQVSILKVDADNAELALEGVVFEVWSGSSADFEAAAALTDDAGDVRRFTTDVEGRITLEPLRYSGWANGAAVQPGEPGYMHYWLVEVETLDGYQLASEPIPFTVDASSATVELVITNQKLPPTGESSLPRTGQIVPPLLIGGGILALIIGAYLVTRRKQAAQEQTTA